MLSSINTQFLVTSTASHLWNTGTLLNCEQMQNIFTENTPIARGG